MPASPPEEPEKVMQNGRIPSTSCKPFVSEEAEMLDGDAAITGVRPLAQGTVSVLRVKSMVFTLTLSLVMRDDRVHGRSKLGTVFSSFAVSFTIAVFCRVLALFGL